MRIGDKEAYWGSIIRNLEKDQSKIKRLLDASKVFSIRINQEESESDNRKKISEMLLKIKNYKS